MEPISHFFDLLTIRYIKCNMISISLDSLYIRHFFIEGENFMYIKKAVLMIVLLLSLLVAINIRSVGAATADTLVVHYYRYDETIDEYDLWLWPSDGSGIDYAFNGSDSYGSFASIDLEGTNLDGASIIGVIVKKNNPWVKDINSDRFINMTNPNSSGEVHVYLLQGKLISR